MGCGYSAESVCVGQNRVEENSAAILCSTLAEEYFVLIEGRLNSCYSVLLAEIPFKAFE
jgi:hypothetical protein